jgi:general secretion pathway protein J
MSGARGFTLLEVLAALLVLAMLILALNQGARFGFSAWGTQARVIAAHDELDAVDRTVRRLVSHIDPGSRDEPEEFSGDAHTVSFTTLFPASGVALPTHRVQVGLGVDSAHRLLLRWSLHPHAERLTPAPPPASTDLLDDVDHLDLAYWRNGAWQTTIADKSAPDLLRLRIVFRAGDQRHWPDIIAAPVREASAE